MLIPIIFTIFFLVRKVYKTLSGRFAKVSNVKIRMQRLCWQTKTKWHQRAHLKTNYEHFKLTRRNVMTCKTRYIITVKNTGKCNFTARLIVDTQTKVGHLFLHFRWHVSEMYHENLSSKYPFVSPYLPIKSAVWIYLV